MTATCPSNQTGGSSGGTTQRTQGSPFARRASRSREVMRSTSGSLLSCDLAPVARSGSVVVMPDELRDDLTSATPEAEAKRLSFIRILNDRLPRKRLIGQGLLRDRGGRVLLCELTYKRDWDLPGGVVDPDESPAHCVVREIREELGIETAVRGLLAVNWLPPYRGWDDALLCLFDLGVVDASITENATLMRREIKGAHWVTRDDLAEHVAPYTLAMLREVLGAVGEQSVQGTLYIEDSRRIEFPSATMESE